MTTAGASNPDSDAADAPSRASSQCLNCGTVFAERFCPHCGQRRDLRPLSLGALVWELLIEILDSDARVWRTLRTLVTKPGQLTLDWAAGRRVRHVPPFRLYLVLNVLVFLVFSFSLGSPTVLNDEVRAPSNEAELEARLRELQTQEGPGAAGQRAGLREALAAVRAARAAEGETPDDLTEFTTDPDLEAALAWLGLDASKIEAAVDDVTARPQAFAERIYERLPTVMIGLLPLLAFVLSVLYLFSGRPYVVHLVGLGHLHAFFFLLLMLIEGFVGFGRLLEVLAVPVLPGLLTWTPTIGFAAAFWYVTRWLTHFYGHSSGGAILMTLFLPLLHFIGAVLGMTLVTIVTFAGKL